MDFAAVRVAIKKSIATRIRSLVVQDMTDAPAVPGVMVSPLAPARFHFTFDGMQPSFRVEILVPYTESGSAQAQLDRYLSTEGPDSVPNAIEADPTLGGVVASATCEELSDYGILILDDGGTKYLSAVLRIEILERSDD